MLQYFRSVEKDTDISRYKGMKLGVDAYSWIHRAIYGSGYNIVVKNDYSKTLKSILARIDVFLHFDIRIVLVLDGDDLPVKSKTEEDRAEYRKIALAKAYEEMEDGRVMVIRQLRCSKQKVCREYRSHTLSSQQDRPSNQGQISTNRE